MDSVPVVAPTTIDIGGEFELDVQSRKLRRGGRPVRIERIPLEILFFLIEKKNELVTRDQIIDRIWGKNVFLDTDNSINGAIRKIRQVLRDDSEDPRFIQTITGSGYRFIAPVTIRSSIAAPPEPLTEHVEPPATPDADSPPSEQVPVTVWKRARLVVGAAALLVIGLVAFLGLRLSERPRAFTGRMMLAVVPFDNLTGDPAQAYFSDGLTEEMITRLGNLDPQRLGVIARTSVMNYRRNATPFGQVIRELGVQYILEGSVRRDAGKLRITAQLIRGNDQTHVWAHEYDRELKDVLTVQDEIADEIADEIQLSLGKSNASGNAAAPAALSPREYEAYDAYLKGQYFFNKRTVPAFEQAIEQFEQATAKDPTDARSYAALADSYMLLSAYSLAPQADFAAKARTAALRALQISPDLPEAHTALALVVEDYDWDWNTAEKEFRRAIELNPNYATAHHWYAEHLLWRGRFDESLQQIERARQLDPLSIIIAADKAAIHYYSRDYDEAIREFRAVLQLEPNYPRAQLIASAYVEKGMLKDALEVIEQYRPTGGPAWYWSTLAYVYGRANQLPQARHALEELQKLSEQEQMDPAVFFWAYAAMGDRDQAFAWLDKAYQQHSSAMPGLKVGPGYDRLRSDPRFNEVLRRIGLLDSE